MASLSDVSKTVTLIHGFGREVVRSGPGPAQCVDDLSAVAPVEWSFDLTTPRGECCVYTFDPWVYERGDADALTRSGFFRRAS